MADVITRFKLETTQFDSKLRDAAKGLKEYTHQAELGGKGFTNFSQKSIEAARSLGTIASGANNAKDKVKDLVGAYNDAANAYNKLSQAQQQSDFGKALAQSIGQLSERVKEAKSELYDLGDAVEKVKSSGGLFGEGGFTGMLQVAGGNLISKGISKLVGELTDAVGKSIELARQGEGIRLAFDRLNQPGLLDQLKEATHGTVSEIELMKQAIQFDNFKLPLEDLATYLAFAQQKAKDTGQSIDYLVNSIVTGLGRQSKQILDNLGISASELTRRMNEGADMTKAVADIIREEMQKAGDYVETAADRAARAAADAANEMEAFGRQAAPIAEEWGQTWNALTIDAMEFANLLLGPVASSIRAIRNILYEGPNGETYKDRIIEQVFNNLKGTNDGNWSGTRGYTSDYQKQAASGGYVVVTDKNGKQIGAKHFDSFDGGVVDTWKQTLSTKSGNRSGSIIDPTAKIQGAWDKAYTKSLQGADKLKPSDVIEMPSVWEKYAKGIRGTFDAVKDEMTNLTEFTPNFDPYTQNMKKMTEAAKQQQAAFNLAGQAAQSFGAALASIDDPSAKAAGQVISAIASIALGFAMASSSANTAGTGWGWLAWLGAGMSAMVTTISTIHSLTGYAQGGIVQGNSYSGDNVGPVMLDAGEVVLNKAQQSALASELQGSGLQNLSLEGVISGETIHIVHNRYLKRSGQGEIVTW